MKFALFIFIMFSNFIYGQLPIVYSMSFQELGEDRKLINYVSVSDQYRLNEHEDSLAIPDEYLVEDSESATTYIRLQKKYRQRCLKALNISENDVVYVYDYGKDRLLRFYVQGLNLIGILSPYFYGGRGYPVSQYDYMIGFEINANYLEGFSDYGSHILVSIGKRNPFTRNKMVPIRWKKVDNDTFPKDAKSFKEDRETGNGAKGDTYQFSRNGMTYFLQNIGRPNDRYGRHVIVIDAESKIILFEKFFMGSEGGDPSMLNVIENKDEAYFTQFTGQLFKYHPPVIFGFMYQSFGCPGIDFIDKNKKKTIYINCDNRH